MTARRLRIAIVAHAFPALSETFVLNQVTGLIELGHDVTVLAGGPRDDPLVHGDVHRFGLLERTVYPRIPKNLGRRVVGGMPRAARLVREGPEKLGAALNVRRYGRAAASGRLLYWGACLADRRRFDVVLAHFGPMGDLAVTLRNAGLLTGRIATVMHGVDVSAYLARKRAPYARLFQAGEMFLPISDTWRRKLLALGCDPSRTAVHHMGVDTDRYPYRPRHRDAGRSMELLTVGRLVEKKGVEYALRAVAAVRDEGLSVRYRIAGDGPLRGELQALAHALSIEDCVTFLGAVAQEDVARLMQEADILLAPSVTTSDGDQEGIPVTLMEAMASGMLVLSTRHSGIPELVEEGRSGVLVPEGDVRALGFALENLARCDARCWPEMSREARRRVEASFDVRRLNRRLEERLISLAESPSA